MMLTKGRSYLWAVVGILILAAGLRLWGIDFGLPYEYHVDEDQYVRPAASMASTKLKPGIWNNPPLFKYVLLAEYGVYFVVGKLMGVFASSGDFADKLRLDPTALYLLGRATSALMGAATVWVTILIGSKAYNRAIGLVSGLFLAVAFLPVREAHFAVNDAAAGLCVSLVLFACIDVYQTGRRRAYLWAGLFLGIGFATKYHTLAAAVPLAIAHFCAPGVTFRKPALTNPLLALGVMLASAAVTSPYFVLTPGEVWPDIIALFRHGQEGFVGWDLDPAGGYVFYLKTMVWGLGWGLFVLSLAGVVAAVVRHRPAELTLLSFPLLVYIFMGRQQMYFGRFLYPIFSPLFVLASAFLYDLAIKFFRGEARQRIALASIVFAICLQPLAAAIRFDVLLTREDTRTTAKRWIEANIPASRIAMDWPFHCPELSTEEKPRVDSQQTYDVWLSDISQGKGLFDHSLDWYRENGFQYLVSCSNITRIPLKDPQQNEERRRFLASLQTELTVLKEIRPYEDDTPPRFIFDEIYGPAVSLWDRDRPGPTVTVYRLDGLTEK